MFWVCVMFATSFLLNLSVILKVVDPLGANGETLPAVSVLGKAGRELPEVDAPAAFNWLILFKIESI